MDALILETRELLLKYFYPVEEFAPNHWIVNHPGLASIFFWENSDGTLSLFDAGTFFFDALFTLKAIHSLGYSYKDVKQLILSHAHIDHIGGTPVFKKYCPNLQIVAHRVEIPFLIYSSRLGSRHLKGIARWVFLPLFRPFEVRPIYVDRPVTSKTKDRDLEFIHMPGHTLGSLAVLMKKSKVLLVGDALYTDDNGFIDYSPSMYSLHRGLEKESVRKLLKYDFEIIISAHGFPILNNGKERLLQFLESN